MKDEMQNSYLFGPVPSRRLGLSLGVDIVPFKVCSLDCVYCQIGKTTEKSIARAEFVPVEPVLAELKEKLAQKLKADFITLSGSGEPTLNSKLGEFVERIKEITDIPVAIITNGTTLSDPAVRADCAKADIVLPSLDAADAATLEKLNRPHSSINVEAIVDGLVQFRKEFAGGIWLEVFLIEGLNTSKAQLGAIADAIKRIGPDKVQVNTAVRPTAEMNVKRIEPEKLSQYASQLGANAEVIADFSASHKTDRSAASCRDVLAALKRRPCSIDDICSALPISREDAGEYLEKLQQDGLIITDRRGDIVFYKAK